MLQMSFCLYRIIQLIIAYIHCRIVNHMYTIIRERFSPLNSYSQVGSQDRETN